MTIKVSPYDMYLFNVLGLQSFTTGTVKIYV